MVIRSKRIDRGVGDCACGDQGRAQRLETVDRRRSVRPDLRSRSLPRPGAMQVGDTPRRRRDRPLLLVPPYAQWVDEEGLLLERDRWTCRLLPQSRSLLLLPDGAGSKGSRQFGSGFDRLATTNKRNQLGGRVRIRASTIRDSGAIAQLGERLRGTQEVGGSSPPGSIGESASLRALSVWQVACCRYRGGLVQRWSSGFGVDVRAARTPERSGSPVRTAWCGSIRRCRTGSGAWHLWANLGVERTAVLV